MSSLSNKKYSLVIPCYNEAENLPRLINNCQEIIADNNYELILVNNGSNDNSLEIMNELKLSHDNIQIVNITKNKGYGHGIVQGLLKANGDILGWTHADNQTHPKDFIKATQLMTSKKLDFVKGKRYGRSLFDSFFSLSMGIFETILLGKFLYEINAQPTVFKKSFFEKFIISSPIDFSLDLYIYYLAKKSGLKIGRFKVYFGKRQFGESKWNTGFRQRIKFIKRTISYSFKLKKSL